jgi:hypothetical protein
MLNVIKTSCQDVPDGVTPRFIICFIYGILVGVTIARERVRKWFTRVRCGGPLSEPASNPAVVPSILVRSPMMVDIGVIRS